MNITVPLPLCVFHQSHESEIHVQLHMTMKEGWSGMVGDKIDLRVAEARNVDDVLLNAGRGFTADLDDLKIAAV
jgi:hypothetical protein